MPTVITPEILEFYPDSWIEQAEQSGRRLLEASDDLEKARKMNVELESGKVRVSRVYGTALLGLTLVLALALYLTLQKRETDKKTRRRRRGQSCVRECLLIVNNVIQPDELEPYFKAAALGGNDREKRVRRKFRSRA